MIMSLKELKENSIEIVPGMVAYYPQYRKEELVDVTNLSPKFNGAYSVNNSTVCFVTEEGGVFVTPYTRKVVKTLEEAGFAQKYFYVPFSNQDYPRDEELKWLRLRESARASHVQEYEEDCAEWCDEHHIGKLGPETLECCFRIPQEGVPVKHPVHNYESVYFPACNEPSMDCTVTDKLGRYTTNNGKVVFVYRDGHTYVTKGYWILDELNYAGYEKGSLFVPFSNWEEITDPRLARQWEEVIKKL